MAHEVVAETGDPGADAAVDAAVDWVAAVLVGQPAPVARAAGVPTTARGGAREEGSAPGCSAAASRLLTLTAALDQQGPGVLDEPTLTDVRGWARQAEELALRLQRHAAALRSPGSGTGSPGHALGLSAGRVRRAALACRVPRGGPALPFQP